MEIYPLTQARLLLFCALFGIAVGVFDDLMRVSVLGKGATNVTGSALRSLTCAALDILSLTLLALGVAVLSYYYNFGEIRAVFSLGAILAAAAYKGLLSRFVKVALLRIRSAALGVAGRCLRPFRSVLGAFGRFCVKIFKKCNFISLKHLKK